ncbi:DUF4870 domain-containing protein [Nocardiopsis sp. CC223A]|uniref:DUF4870 domain-containing protein n=1 Tax=Nocardiopsis sp. CC223A TaxID=3044051 RepID=UPI00278C4BA9|nr:DUF4870 domain-containing protein [Nocardiopsis sp. CC223A]
MSYPNTPPPEDPYGQHPQQGGQGQSGGYPAPGQQNPSGGYPAPGAQQPGGYQDPSGGYPPPGAQPGGYPPPGPQQPGGYPPPGGYQEQTGGYQAPGYQQGGYGPQPGSATGAPPSADERQFGLFAHLGGGLLGFVVPLVIYLIKRDESPFIRDQSAQALNFQLLILIGYVVSGVLSIVFIGAITWFLCWVAAVVFGILGGVAANKGEWYRYPFNVSWIK